ncbi:hypothetical protein ACIHEI_05760 [Kitasatospora sp. NPDC051984]|uniref:hypothetical protein n=1 Tax=Kitasatospora sp. NPDC051984 TaxID=3364059 RepID=UPI0037C79E40
MQESELRRKLRERQESAKLAEIGRELSGLFTGRALVEGEMPAWVRETEWGFWDMSAEPAAVLSDEEAPAVVDAWIESLLAQHGITGTVFVSSHLSGYPWIECDAPSSGWVTGIRKVLADPWVFVNSALDLVVSVTEGEHYYQAHVGRRPES